MLLKIAMAALYAAVAFPLAASADAVPDAAQKAIASSYQFDCTATQDPTDANLNTAFAVLAPDFVHVDFKGKQMQRDEFIAQGKQQIKQLHVTSCANTIDSSKLADPNTIVVVVTSGKGRVDSSKLPTAITISTRPAARRTRGSSRTEPGCRRRART